MAGLELALVDVHSQGHHRRADVEVVGEGQDGEVQVACGVTGISVIKRNKQTDRNKDKKTDGHTFTQKAKHTDKNTEKQDIQSDRHIYKQTEGQSNIQTDIQIDRQTERQTFIQTDIQTYCQTEKKTNTQTEIQTDRQSDRKQT